MGEQQTQDGITESQIEAAYDVLEVLRENLSDDGMENMSSIINEAHYLVQQYDEGANWKEFHHTFEVGDFTIDDREPTPSPEANTVKVIELTHTRADEYETDEDKLVSEYKYNRFYPDDDPVVIGTYPNMSDDREWAFPESRLRKV